jgi:hypothetical protein
MLLPNESDSNATLDTTPLAAKNPASVTPTERAWLRASGLHVELVA